MYWERSQQECVPSRDIIVLYDGPAVVAIGRNSEGASTKSLIVSSSKQSFAFYFTTPTTLCETAVYLTEHTQLYVNFYKETNRVFQITKWSYENVDLQIYVDTKFTYVERNFKANLLNLYNSLSAEQCKIEQRTLRNLLTLAYINPDLFAFTYTGEPGFSALVRGEVIYLIECVAVPVSFRTESKYCYTDIPIYYDNQEAFLSSRNHLVVMTSTQVECTSIFQTLVHLHEGWFSLYPDKHLAFEPSVLSPNTDIKYTYKDLPMTTQLGVYTSQQIEGYQQSLILPAERQSIMQNIAIGFHGQDISEVNGRVSNLFVGSEINRALSGYWSRIFGISVSIGEWIAFFLGITALIRIIVGVVNTIVNIHILYQTLGFGWNLFAALFESLTHLILMKNDISTERKTTRVSEDQNLNTTAKEVEIVENSKGQVTATAPLLYPSLPLMDTRK